MVTSGSGSNLPCVAGVGGGASEEQCCPMGKILLSTNPDVEVRRPSRPLSPQNLGRPFLLRDPV